MKKIILNIFLFLILSNCGYSPLLIRNIQDFNIQIEVIEGDRLINNLVISQLNRNKNEKSENKINININTKYTKTIYSRDATGAVASYELNVVSEFNLTKKDVSQNIVIIEKFIMDKNDNAFDENNYERTIKKTFASSIAQKIILKLNSIK
jgi:hypothetical protein